MEYTLRHLVITVALLLGSSALFAQQGRKIKSLENIPVNAKEQLNTMLRSPRDGMNIHGSSNETDSILGKVEHAWKFAIDTVAGKISGSVTYKIRRPDHKGGAKSVKFSTSTDEFETDITYCCREDPSICNITLQEKRNYPQCKHWDATGYK